MRWSVVMSAAINVDNAAQVWLSSAFAELTEHQPFPWQGRMFDSLLHGEMPEHVDIATGLGKTSVIHLWLLALAWSLEHGTATLSQIGRASWREGGERRGGAR